MNTDIDFLVEQWLDDSMIDSQQQILLTWLKENPQHMQRFVEANIRHQMLRDAATGVLKADEAREVASVLQTVPASIDSARPTPLRWVAGLIGLAACLLLAVGWWMRAETQAPQLEPFVTVAMVQDIDSDLKVGDRLGSRAVKITTGLVRLTFDDGVEVTIQAPAHYELTGLGKSRLLRGLLTATVPPGAEGFQVTTPTAEVVDLGTVFGIALEDDGSAMVSVFDGEVEVKPNSSRDKKLVHEGEAVRVTDKNEIQSYDFDAVPYEKMWPASSGIVGSTGAFRLAPPWPRRMGLAQSDSEIFILPEGYPQTLTEPLNVNIVQPGQYLFEAELTAGQLPIGTRGKCFLLQFKPVDRNEKETGIPPEKPAVEKLQRIVGEITFDRPVLGLIVLGEDLRASDGRFSKRGGQVPQKGRGLELFGSPRDDIIELSEDRRTIKLDLAAFGIYCDQVRVITEQALTK